MDERINLIDMVLRECSVTTEEPEIIAVGGTLSFKNHISLKVKDTDNEELPADTFRAVCDIEITGTGESESKEKTLKISVTYQGFFNISQDLAKELDGSEDEDPELAIQFVNLMFPAIRCYLNTTLELVGVSGYKLPWGLLPD